MTPRRAALVRHTFLPADADPAVLAAHWAEASAGLDDEVPARGPFTEVRRRDVKGGLHEAAIYRLPDVIGVGVLIAPNDDRLSWADLERAHPAPATPAEALGTVTVQAGLGRLRRAGFARTAGGVSWWDLPDAADGRRLVLALSAPRDEAALGRFLWADAGAVLPPLTRYLAEAARLRHQRHVLVTALPGLRAAGDRTRSACSSLVDLLRESRPQVAQLRAADTALGLARTERGGLITATADARDMAATVHAAARNLEVVLGPDLTSRPGSPVDRDRALAGWLDQQLTVELTYLESAARQADELSRLAGAVIDGWQQGRQESLTLLQTSILGGLLTALAAVQSLDYRVPLPGPVLAPLIALLAAVAVLLPAAVTRRLRFGRWMTVGAALLGGATGWLVSSLISQSWWLAAAGAALFAFAAWLRR